jgi:hypothetical protein
MHVVIATTDQDFGLVPADLAMALAQEIANQDRTAVTLRCPVTDGVIETVRPDQANPRFDARTIGVPALSNEIRPRRPRGGHHRHPE